MIVITGILLITLTIFLNWCYKIYKNNKQLEKIPGPLPIPFFGYKLSTNVYGLKKMFDELTEKYGKTFKLYIGESLHVVTCDAELIEQLLKSNIHIHKSGLYDLARDWLKNGLIVSSGYIWRARRKICTPSFHFTMLQDFFILFKKSSDTLIRKLGEQADKGAEINAIDFMSKFAFEIIAESSLGIKMDIQNGERLDYIKSVNDVTEILFTRFFSIWKRSPFLFKLFSKDYKRHKNALDVIHGTAMEVIQEKRNDCGDEDQFKKRAILIDQLMINSKLPDSAIQEEINNFVFAGYDTTSTAMSFALFELSRNPDVQEKLYREIKLEIDNDFSKLTPENLQSMKYLDQVVKEVFRLRTAVPLIERKLQEDAKFGEVVYPKGTVITILLYWLHNHKDYYPDPEIFDPERFSPENPNPHPTFAFVPFSAGPRNCIGQKYALLEFKTILARIIMEFKIHPVAGAKLELGMAAVLVSKYGFPIKLKRR